MTVEPHARTALAVALMLSAVATTGGCTQPATEEVESAAVVTVTTAPAVRGTILGTVHANGTVSPAPGAEHVVVAPEAARIAELPRAAGDRVRTGDLLVRFELPNATADVQRQQAEVGRAQAVLDQSTAARTRATDLFGRGVAARKDVEEASRAVSEAEAALAQAHASLTAAQVVAGRAVVRASFDGVVAKRFHNAGDLVDASAGDPILRVIDPRRLEVVASIPLADAARVTLSAVAHLESTPFGATGVGLKVLALPVTVEPGTATIPVRLGFTGRTDLPAGTPVQVAIDAERHAGVVLVPLAAIVREGDETAVFVADGSKAHRRTVRVGLQDASQVEILSGIAEGDRVIVDGQAGLPDEASIRESDVAGAK